MEFWVRRELSFLEEFPCVLSLEREPVSLQMKMATSTIIRKLLILIVAIFLVFFINQGNAQGKKKEVSTCNTLTL